MEHDQQSPEERRVYDEVQRVRSSDNGELISDTCARILTSWWHDGQVSAFYSFQSTGAIDLDNLIPELLDNLRVAETDEETESLDELARYFVFKGNRGPQENWHENNRW